jgi:hypothetical protein
VQTGDLTVSRNVSAGAELRVGGDLRIGGCVEHARINCAGELQVPNVLNFIKVHPVTFA